MESVRLAIAGVDAVFTHQVAEFIEQYRPALESLAKIRDHSYSME